MNYDVEINGIAVHAEYSEDNINNIFIPMLKRMKQMQEQKKSRILVMLAAPPGAGKSTLLSFLQHLSMTVPGLNPVTVIGMDGFHRYQDYLLSHTLMRDGKEYKMVDVKGTPETFDLNLFIERVKRVAAGEICGWPAYNRMTHNPEEDAVTVNGDIVILEGNYLLLERPGWSELQQYADLTIRITADEKMLRKRLLDRKIKSGTEPDKAAQFVDFSDMYNVRICLNESYKADIELNVLNDGSYEQSN